MFTGAKESSYRFIDKLLQKYGVKTVADMTCGTGGQVFYLAEKGYEIVGSDFSPGLLEIARKKSCDKKIWLNFVDGDRREIYLSEFDAIIAIDNAIGHLVRDDFMLALSNIKRNLKQ